MDLSRYKSICYLKKYTKSKKLKNKQKRNNCDISSNFSFSTFKTEILKPSVTFTTHNESLDSLLNTVPPHLSRLGHS